jgi:membrane protein DedA with SNARE-associated domain
LEDFILGLQSLDPVVIYLVVFSIAYIENIFPPSPSDLVVVFAGSLVGIHHIGPFWTLVAATAGSTLGFVTMYKIGDLFGDRILERGRIPFIPLPAVRKAEAWFTRYGYWLIIANRFLAGTRAVVSFFAGMSDLDIMKTTVLSFVSALVWNTILVSAGYFLGRNWQRIGFYLSTYGQIVTGIVVLVVLVLIAKYLYQQNTAKTKE